jgi:hypothetical protein
MGSERRRVACGRVHGPTRHRHLGPRLAFQGLTRRCYETHGSKLCIRLSVMQGRSRGGCPTTWSQGVPSWFLSTTSEPVPTVSARRRERPHTDSMRSLRLTLCASCSTGRLRRDPPFPSAGRWTVRILPLSRRCNLPEDVPPGSGVAFRVVVDRGQAGPRKQRPCRGARFLGMEEVRGSIPPELIGSTSYSLRAARGERRPAGASRRSLFVQTEQCLGRGQLFV